MHTRLYKILQVSSLASGEIYNFLKLLIWQMKIEICHKTATTIEVLQVSYEVIHLKRRKHGTEQLLILTYLSKRSTICFNYNQSIINVN